MDDVVLHILRTEHEVADQFGVLWHGDAERVLDRAHAGQGMDGGADSAGAFGESPGVTRIPAFEDFFETADHGSRAVGVCDDAILHYGLNAKMTLDSGNRVDDNACHKRSPHLLDCSEADSSCSSVMSLCLRILVLMACAATPAIAPIPTTVPTVSAVLSIPNPGNAARCW